MLAIIAALVYTAFLEFLLADVVPSKHTKAANILVAAMRYTHYGQKENAANALRRVGPDSHEGVR